MNRYYKKITIEVYYISGGEDWYDMVLTRVTSVMMKRRFLIPDKIMDKPVVICDGKNNEVMLLKLEDHLDDQKRMRTNTLDSLTPHKIRFKEGYGWKFTGSRWYGDIIHYHSRVAAIKETIKKSFPRITI